MKVGIITICKCNNYGAELQATATQKMLERLGYESEIIDYCYYKTWNFKNTNMSHPLVPMGMKGRLMCWLKYRLVNALLTLFLPLIDSEARRRNERFDAFHKDNTRMSRKYMSMDDLYSNVPKYDVYMTGSDQVWNPAASSSIEPYFLTFAPEGGKKVSYASSFGVSSIDKNLHGSFGNWLSCYESIAVREDSGRELVKSLSGKDAEWVIDPTLLLNKEQWMMIAKKYESMPDRYVIIYQLSDSDAIETLALRIGKEKGIPVYRICKRAYGVRKTHGIRNILDAGPAEFVSLVAGAEYVVTNSFHGTAFAVNFGVPFFTVVSAAKKNNSRMESLLGLVGLTDRMIMDDCVINNVDFVSTVDYEKAHRLLDEARKKSVDYLMRALA